MLAFLSLQLPLGHEGVSHACAVWGWVPGPTARSVCVLCNAMCRASRSQAAGQEQARAGLRRFVISVGGQWVAATLSCHPH